MPGGFLDKLYTDARGKQHRHVLFEPHTSPGEQGWPVIVFLHGSGESGWDGRKPIEVGLGPVVKEQEATFPFLVVFPQSRTSFWEADFPDANRAMAILTEIENTYRVDRKRIYLTGYSLGAFGTWSLAARYPSRWAAIVPVCGGGDPGQAAAISHIPCWCFHGAADAVADVILAREMIDALREGDCQLRYTEYPDEGHDCWEKAYRTPELFPWLLAQALP